WNGSMPLAYRAPTTLPALVPATTSGVRPLASSILITPIWAKPLAAPPPRARPIFGGGTTGSGSTGATGSGGVGRTLSPPQAASSAPASMGRSRRQRRGRGVRTDAGRFTAVGTESGQECGAILGRAA